MKILVTGAAGFIGMFLTQKLISQGYEVVNLDSVNDYYDVNLKLARLALLEKNKKYKFIKGNMADKELVFKTFENEHFDVVINLAAQAGVRYSITNPDVYMESNVIGFYNILEACRKFPVSHLIYASSSSVYGNQQKVPFSTDDDVSHPISLYAATKKSDELMAYTYSHLYKIPTTGLRFFTVYGPYGRPDMAYYSFTNRLVKGEPITIFNYGDMRRDFTYIDDIVEGITRMVEVPPDGDDPYALYNIGNNKPEDLLNFVETLERCLIKEGIIKEPGEKIFAPMQPGDVYQTYADVEPLQKKFGFKPSTTIEEGLGAFAHWYKQYYGL